MHSDQTVVGNVQFLFNCLTIAEISFGILVTFILFVFKKNKKANFFLAFFISIYSATFLPIFFLKNNLIMPAVILSLITIPANSLIGVLLYYYTLFMTGRTERLNKKDIVHFSYILVYLAFIMAESCLYYTGIISYDFKSLALPQIYIPVIDFAIIVVGLLNSFAYTILSFIKIKKYSSEIKNYASDIDGIDMSWLKKIIYFSITATLVFMLCFSTAITSTMYPFVIYFATFDMGVFIVMLFIVAFYAINQPEASKENPEVYNMLNNLNENNKPAKKYGKVYLDITKQELYLKLLNEYMEKNKPYLNERITIRDLSEGLDLPYYHLSIVINNLLKINFYDYINEYRIQEVLNILNKSKNEAVDILTIAFKCGFNSKTTFNRVFKKKMGTTPSNYKNSFCESVQMEKCAN